MNQENFHAPQAGQVVLAPGGYWAFIPAPLPPKIDYDPGLVVSLSRADAALSELSGLGRYMINPHLLIASYIRKEAVLSSRIEGTRAGIADLLIDDLDTPNNHKDDDITELHCGIGIWNRTSQFVAVILTFSAGNPCAFDGRCSRRKCSAR